MAMRLGSSYTLESLVGRGGMGEVWRGHDQDGRVLAFKVLLPELATDQKMVARFIREQSVLRRIRSPFVVNVWDLVAEHDRLAIVMDFIEGPDLRQYLRSRGTLSPAEAVALTVDILTGLGVAHALGIVHRDLKPANVLLDASGPAPHPKVTDFGIASVVGSTRLTTSQDVFGTPTYMAPEMVNSAQTGPPADVYAAGVMLYELVSGVAPFAGPMPLAVMRAHVDLLPGRPPGLDDALWTVLSAMLAKNPADRPGVADLCALQPGLAGRPALPPLRWPPPPVATESWPGPADTADPGTATPPQPAALAAAAAAADPATEAPEAATETPEPEPEAPEPEPGTPEPEAPEPATETPEPEPTDAADPGAAAALAPTAQAPGPQPADSADPRATTQPPAAATALPTTETPSPEPADAANLRTAAPLQLQAHPPAPATPVPATGAPGPKPRRPRRPPAANGTGSMHGARWRRFSVVVTVMAVLIVLGATALKLPSSRGPDPDAHHKLAANDPRPEVHPSTTAASPATAEPGHTAPAVPPTGTGAHPTPDPATGPAAGDAPAGRVAS
ncbi:serine/threonine-protein kinase, partial [Frankia sp. R82]|uniref:serine/threonine-protein kinase n=1 Tax=Frankia sp. R82 TaxID=2950553 RepID=UPI0020430DEE